MYRIIKQTKSFYISLEKTNKIPIHYDQIVSGKFNDLNNYC